MRIGLLIIATNKYIQFLQDLISSADKYFLKNEEVVYYIFTNKKIEIKSNRKIVIIDVDHKPFPWMTLERYKIFNNSKDILSDNDYLYYCDVDMRFVDEVSNEIISERVATQHPGFFGRRGTPETNPNSLACVKNNEYMEYFAGGFNGGSSYEYLKMSNILSNNIKKDYENNIIAIWHDESHLNRYFIDNKPTLILSPSYCYGESMNIPFVKKLLALDKDHKKIRDEDGI